MNFLHSERGNLRAGVCHCVALACLLTLVNGGLCAQSPYRDRRDTKDPSTKEISKYLLNKDLSAAVRSKDPPLLPANVPQMRTALPKYADFRTRARIICNITDCLASAMPPCKCSQPTRRLISAISP